MFIENPFWIRLLLQMKIRETSPKNSTGWKKIAFICKFKSIYEGYIVDVYIFETSWYTYQTLHKDIKVTYKKDTEKERLL